MLDRQASYVRFGTIRAEGRGKPNKEGNRWKKCFSDINFDGTTRLGEALATVVRFVTNDWTIEHRLVKMQLLAKSLTGKEITRELIHVLATEYNVGSNNLLAVMRDRASTNEVAMKTISVLIPV